MEWISVKERLPEASGGVIVFAWLKRREYWETISQSDSKQVNEKRVDCWRDYTVDRYYGDEIPSGITHWMPLPEPPKESE